MHTIAHPPLVRTDLPTGTVTFLLTDVERSTSLLEELGAERYAKALIEHRGTIGEACATHDGAVVDSTGDGFLVAFPIAASALAAARDAQTALAAGPVRVRMGVHTGTPLLTETGYVGIDVHRAARIAAAGHGDQVLVSAATRALVGDVFELVDLGEHRLKDIAGAERLFQLGSLRFPPLRTLHQANLPGQATPLIGRESEVADVVRLLAGGEVSVVTLTGAGGSGKTRLLTRIAGEVTGSYRDGAWYVALGSLTDPSLVFPTIAQTLGLREGAGRTYRDVLAEHLRARQLLLALDNLEHLLPDVATAVAELVAAAPGLTVLASSREPLHITAEHEYPVLPLPLPDAVALFVERATAARPDFAPDADRQAIEAICQRLDGLPLAVELAAARVKALAVSTLLDRLELRLPLLTGGARDAPERQRTLRATIAWSHELLGVDERRLYASLAVFSGGWTLPAAEAVCEAQIDILGSLIDKNLIRQDPAGSGEPRFSMLETIREFALERLERLPDASELRRRHAQHFAAVGLEAEPELVRRDQRWWLDCLDAEHDNLRAALRWLVRGDPVLALRLAAGLFFFWLARGHAREARGWLLAALERAPADPSEARARALDWTAFMCQELGEDTSPYSEHAIACARAVNATATLATALSHRSLYLPADRRGEAVALAREALALAERAGDPFVLARVLNNLGLITTLQGEFEAADQLLSRAYELQAGMGDVPRMAMSLGNTARAALALGDSARARTLAEQAAELDRGVGVRRQASYATAILGWAALAESRIDDAAALFNEALALVKASSFGPVAPIVLRGLAAIAAARRDGCRAALLAASAEHAVAARFHFSEQTPAEAAILGRHLLAARTGIDQVLWDTNWRRGAELSIEAATALILEDSV